jgi:RNA ligase (TIGR02306 family)
MRKLASIRQITEILPIEGADLIVRVRVDDWYCVALKTEFKPGDLCVYFEIDSFIPIIPQVEHLRAKAFKRMGEKEGIRIKTIRLKGQISQGLALPVHAFFDMFANSKFDEGQELSEYFFVGNDVSDLIGVEKYEQPIPAELGGQVKSLLKM